MTESLTSDYETDNRPSAHRLGQADRQDNRGNDKENSAEIILHHIHSGFEDGDILGFHQPGLGPALQGTHCSLLAPLCD